MERDPPARIPANDGGCAAQVAAAVTPTASVGKPIRVLTRCLVHMRFFPLLSRAAALPLALAAACPTFTHAQGPSLKETVVTATRSATRADELVSDVTVIDRAAIDASTARTLPELLARTAGVQMSASGGLGKVSSVFIRGAENRHTILMVDGVRLGSATAGTPSWDNIPVEMIERIEVLKGPASALYGSDGVAGVVQVFLRKGREGFHPHASTTVGSHRHRAAHAGVQAGQGAWRYSLGAQRLRHGGFSATNANAPFGQFHPDRDPFEQDSVHATASHELGSHWSIDGAWMHAEGVSAFDDGPGIDARSAVRAFTGHVGVKGRPLPLWQTELRLAQGNDTNNTIEAAFPGSFKTGQAQWIWQNHIDTPLGLVLAGLERRVQKVGGSVDYPVKRRTIDSVFAGLNGSSGAHSWQVNARRDANSQFGDVNTWLAGYGYRVAPEWRVHASRGTSFVAPSFNQLYFPFFGNPTLLPERGRNTDLGVTWSAGGHELKLVRFDNRIRGFMTNTVVPTNVHARIEGWTLSYDGTLGPLGVRAALDALDPRHVAGGLLLPRRARRQLSAGADYHLGPWRLGAALVHVGDRFDDAANLVQLPAYATADLHADWQLAPHWSVQAKLNNVTDRRYETAWGYNQGGRSLFLTLRWQPK
jgi:vitamin B12 transporter